MTQYPQKAFHRAALMGLMLTVTLLACGQSLLQDDIEATVAAGVEATRQAEAKVQATINAAVVATQVAATQAPATEVVATQPAAQSTSDTVAPTATTLPQLSDQEQVRLVILAEVNGAIDQDLTLLKSLYAPNATIVDRNSTPADTDDDTTWRGWVNIERRYAAFFASGFSTARLVDLVVEIENNRATGTHQGVILDDVFYEDLGIYSLEQIEGQWLITQLEYGNKGPEIQPTVASRDDGLFVLELGNQHRYEEPWGWDQGDPCQAWQSGEWDDTKPNYRGFNIELLLTNNSEEKAPDDWPVTFTTAQGKSVPACYYAYDGSGPPPGATNSVTFFTVVEKGDYVEVITFQLNDQLIRLCLDGQGHASKC